MTKKKTLKIKFKLFEFFIFAIIALMIIVPTFMKISYKSKIYLLNIEIRNLTVNIEKQQNLNESYILDIKEKTSFENLSRLANEYGLVLDNESTFVLKDE